MAIELTSGTGGRFRVLDEGNYTFYIYDVVFKEDFGHLQIKYVTQDGNTTIEFLRLLKEDGSNNDWARDVFSDTAHAALGDDVERVETPAELIGHYINATVKHNVIDSKDKPGETKTFVNLVDKTQSDGFDGEPSAKCLAIIKKAENKNVDLGDLLDD